MFFFIYSTRWSSIFYRFLHALLGYLIINLLFLGTSTYDMITTTVTAPPLEDSDGVADFLPDLTDRMSEFDNNNIDAEDNFDALGMMERLPDTVKAGKKAGETGKEKEKVEKKEENRGENKGDDLCESGTLGGANRDNSPPITTPPHSNTATPQSVLRNRKTHTEVTVSRDTSTSTSVNVSATDSNALNNNNSSSQHTHSHDGQCCTGTTHNVVTTLRMSHSTSTSNSTSSSISNHSSSINSSGSISSSSYTSTTTSLYTAASSTTDTDSPRSEQEALLRARLASQEDDSNESVDVDEERIHLAQQRLAQNLQQVCGYFVHFFCVYCNNRMHTLQMHIFCKVNVRASVLLVIIHDVPYSFKWIS